MRSKLEVEKKIADSAKLDTDTPDFFFTFTSDLRFERSDSYPFRARRPMLLHEWLLMCFILAQSTPISYLKEDLVKIEGMSTVKSTISFITIFEKKILFWIFFGTWLQQTANLYIILSNALVSGKTLEKGSPILAPRIARPQTARRAYVSKGAAPTLFETVGASTHAFLQIFGYFWMALWKTCRVGEKEVWKMFQAPTVSNF